MTPLGLYLQQKRREQGVTQKEMAVALGVSPAYLSALEHGHRGKPSFAFLQRLTGYLNIIWDEAEELQRLADLSDTRVVVDTQNLSSEATELANRLAQTIDGFTEDDCRQLLTMIEDVAKPE